MENPIKNLSPKKLIPKATEFIAIAFILFSFYVFRIILLKDVKADSAVEISIVEAVKGILYIIIGFYFGSSMGSKKKEEMMSNNKPQDPNSASHLT